MQIRSTHRLAAAGDTAYDVVSFSIPGDEAPSSVGIMRCRPVAIILAYDIGDGFFVLADEPRVGAEANVVRGVAGGTIDSGRESQKETAARKLRDELGLDAKVWTLVARDTYSSPGRTDEQAWLWLAEGLSSVGPADRCTAPVRRPLDELDTEIARFRDASPDVPRRDLKALTLLLALKLERLDSPSTRPAKTEDA